MDFFFHYICARLLNKLKTYPGADLVFGEYMKALVHVSGIAGVF